jgi:hypothetical protein
MATNLLNINSITPKTSSFDVSWNGAASLDKRYSHQAGSGAISGPPAFNSSGTGASFKYGATQITVTHREFLGQGPSFSVTAGLVVGRSYTVILPFGVSGTVPTWSDGNSATAFQLMDSLRDWYIAVGCILNQPNSWSTRIGYGGNEYYKSFPPVGTTFVATSDTPLPAGLLTNIPKLAQTNNLVTLTTSSPHGLSVGDKVYLELYETSSSGYGFSNNTFYTVADTNLVAGIAPSSTTISFIASTSASTYAKTPVNASLFTCNTNIFHFTGDYTIEGFAVLTGFYNGSGTNWATSRWLFRATDGTNSFGVRAYSTNTPAAGIIAEAFINSTGASASGATSGDRSCHFALVRKGSKVEFLVNGYLVMSFTSSGTHGYPSALCTTDDGLIISNFRVTDRALYDSANMSIASGILSYDLFPKGPLTAVAGTRLLTFQDPTLKDNSGNNYVVSCVNRNSDRTLNSSTTISASTPFSRIGGIQWTDVRNFPGTRQSILTNPAGSNKNIKINSLRIFARVNTNGYLGYYGWEIGVIDADSKVNIIASSQFLKSTMNDASEFAGGKNFIGDVIDSPIYLSEGTTLFGAVFLETYFSGTIAYEEIS